MPPEGGFPTRRTERRRNLQSNGDRYDGIEYSKHSADADRAVKVRTAIPSQTGHRKFAELKMMMRPFSGLLTAILASPKFPVHCTKSMSGICSLVLPNLAVIIKVYVPFGVPLKLPPPQEQRNISRN